MKNKLEKLVKEFETENFIKSDPIQFPHRFKEKENIEIAGFIASLFAFGNRVAFIKKLDELFEIMDNNPIEFIKNFKSEKLEGFYYRIYKDIDFIAVFEILQKLYKKEQSSLELLFKTGYEKKHEIQTMFQYVTDYFYGSLSRETGKSFYQLLPNPSKGGAMKRMNMFLRWMVRKGKVDLGIWDFLPAEELLIPLDVHVARQSRNLGLLNCKADNFKAVLELTDNLKKLDAKDPVKYDFALFGYGISNK